MEKKQKAIQKTTSIVNQGERVLGLYKLIVKSGGVPTSIILTTTAKNIMRAGKIFHKF